MRDRLLFGCFKLAQEGAFGLQVGLDPAQFGDGGFPRCGIAAAEHDETVVPAVDAALPDGLQPAQRRHFHAVGFECFVQQFQLPVGGLVRVATGERFGQPFAIGQASRIDGCPAVDFGS